MIKEELVRIKKIMKELNSEDPIKENSVIALKNIKKEIEHLLKNVKLNQYKNIDKVEKNILLHNKHMFFKKDIINRFPQFSEKEVTLALKNLVKEEKLEKIGKNFYTNKKNIVEPDLQLSPEIKEIQHVFNDKGIIFLITGLGILQEYVNLLPKRIINLIYVVKGSGETAKELIEKKLNKISILNPSRKEVRNLLQHYEEDITIIKEVGESSIEYHNQGIAKIEKAIVDLYFETTRKRIPFETSELTYILKNTLPKVRINYTRLLRAAARRNIQFEFIRILHSLEVEIPHEKIKKELNDKAEKIIRMLNSQ